MPSPFKFTNPTTNTVPMQNGTGRVRQTVTNESGRTLQVITRVETMPPDSPAKAWIRVEPEGATMVRVNGTTHFDVVISVPEGETLAEPVGFRLIAADEHDPEENFTAGPDMSFAPTGAAVPARRGVGMIIAAVVVALVVVGVIIAVIVLGNRGPGAPEVRLLRDQPVYNSPDPGAGSVDLLEDTVLPVTGVSDDGAWYRVTLENGDTGWIPVADVEPGGDMESVEVVALPTSTPTSTSTQPAPTDTPTFTPTPTATLDPICRATVATDMLNFRRGPGTEYETISDPLPTGTVLQVTGRLEDNRWVQVVFNGQQGWIAVNGAEVYSELSGDCSGVPVLLPPPTNTPTPTPTLTPSRTPTPAFRFGSVDMDDFEANRFISSNFFRDAGIASISPAPSGSYCSDANAITIVASGYSGGDHVLMPATSGNMNRCTGVPVAIRFEQPVRSVLIRFHGANVAYRLSIYDTSGNLVDTMERNGVLNGGAQTMQWRSRSSNIQSVIFGHQTAITAISEIEFQR